MNSAHLLPTNDYGEFRDAVIEHEKIDMSEEPDHEALAKVQEKLKF